MVPALFFYQLVLIALVWLYFMLHGVWPSASAACPMTPEPLSPLPKRKREPKPFVGLTHKPHCDACEHATDSRPQAPSAPPPRIVSTRGRRRRSTPPPISVRTWIAGTGGGRDGGISAPTAIPMGDAGANCCASSVAATFSRLSARSFMASTPPLSSSCASSRA